MSEIADENSRRIDLADAVRALWRHKWAWLAIFAVITALGVGYTLTRPTNTEAKVWVQLTLPETDSQATATQQSAMLTPLALSYKELATASPYSDEFVAQFPEFEGQVGAVVQVELRSASLLEFKSTGPDKDRQAELVTAAATSFVNQLNSSADAQVLRGKVHGDPALNTSQANRTLLLAISLCTAAAVATAATGVVAHRHRAGQQRQ